MLLLDGRVHWPPSSKTREVAMGKWRGWSIHAEREVEKRERHQVSYMYIRY